MKCQPWAGFLNLAVESEEQEDVTAGDALVVEMTLRDAGLAEHSPPLLPIGSVLPMSVRVEVQVGVQGGSDSGRSCARW